MIDLEVDVINTKLGIAILNDGQEINICAWTNHLGRCLKEQATTCVAGPDFDGTYYVIKLSYFKGISIC